MPTNCRFIVLAALFAVVSCNREGGGPSKKADGPEAVPTVEAKPALVTAPAAAPVSMEKFLKSALDGDLATVKQALTQPGAAAYADENGRTALMLAAFNGHTEIAELLLESGAKIDVRDGIKRTALMYAASGPNVVTVAMLVKRGAGVNLTDGEQNWTPLMFAAAEGHTEVARILLGAGADPNAIDSDGDTSLMFAQGKGFKEIADMITEAKARTGNPAK
jgi:ankyrin repeat protein